MEIFINKLEKLDRKNITKQDANDMIAEILKLDESEINYAICVVIDFFQPIFENNNLRLESNVEDYLEIICSNEIIGKHLDELANMNQREMIKIS